jgi:hypothetical protein
MILFIFLFIDWCVVLGLQLKDCTLSWFTSPFFVMGFFEIGFGEQFAQDGSGP